MISLILIFGCLCRSSISIPRLPRNIAQVLWLNRSMKASGSSNSMILLCFLFLCIPKSSAVANSWPHWLHKPRGWGWGWVGDGWTGASEQGGPFCQGPASSICYGPAKRLFIVARYTNTHSFQHNNLPFTSLQHFLNNGALCCVLSYVVLPQKRKTTDIVFNPADFRPLWDSHAARRKGNNIDGSSISSAFSFRGVFDTGAGQHIFLKPRGRPG